VEKDDQYAACHRFHCQRWDDDRDDPAKCMDESGQGPKAIAIAIAFPGLIDWLSRFFISFSQ
jgi:hypothetical protein